LTWIHIAFLSSIFIMPFFAALLAECMVYCAALLRLISTRWSGAFIVLA